MPVSDACKQAVRAEMRAAPHGQRGATAQRLAETLHISVSSVYRIIDDGLSPRRPRRTREDYQDWVRRAVVMAQAGPPGKPLPLKLALRAAIESGSLPREAALMPLSTAYRLRRKMGLHREEKRRQGLDADYPMQALQFDGSSSMFIAVDGPDGDDWRLKLYRRPISARGYKNKPLGPDRERLIIYGTWDMYSGYRLARYVVAKGETALDAMHVLLWCLGEHGDERLAQTGLPDDLWSDLGPIIKDAMTVDLLDRLGVNIELGEPYNKTRQGGIESGWRVIWQSFERALFAGASDTLRLSDLNNRLVNFLVEWNERPARRLLPDGRRVSRAQAWTLGVNMLRPDNPLRALPPDALSTAAREAERRVDGSGRLSWDGEKWEVEDLYDCRVSARRSLDGETLVVTCLETGVQKPAVRLRPRPYGTVEQHAASPLHKLLDEQAATGGGVDLYRQPPQAAGPSALPLTPRIADPAPLNDPLSLAEDVHPDLDAAMADFVRLCPVRMSAGQGARVRQAIADSTLSRERVRQLAAALLQEASNAGSA